MCGNFKSEVSDVLPRIMRPKKSNQNAAKRVPFENISNASNIQAFQARPDEKNNLAAIKVEPGPKERYDLALNQQRLVQEKLIKIVSNFETPLICSLVLISRLRSIVFRIPTLNDVSNKSIAFDLQRIFADRGRNMSIAKSIAFENLQFTSPCTLLAAIIDNLEDRLKGTMDEGSIRSMFTGKLKRSVGFLDSRMTPSVTEEFTSIELPVQDCNNLDESLKKFFKPVMNENKRHESVSILQLPTILYLHMNRLQYNEKKGVYQRVSSYKQSSLNRSNFQSFQTLPGVRKFN
jgi:hypothetical protein